MPHRCAFGCKVSGNVVHSFPNPSKFPERFKAWVDLVGSNLKTLTDHDIYKKRRICDIHFTDEHRNRFKRLNALAMPTLYLPGTKKENPPNLTACDKPATGEVGRGDEQECGRPALCDAMLSSAASSADDDSAEPSAPPLIHLHTAQMCRVCLALDVKMFHLRDTKLKIMFQSITGIEFEDNEGSNLGSLICWECAARLRAASTFRSKALLSDTLLQRLINKGELVENNYFETIKEEADRMISPKTLTATDIIHIVDIEDQNNMSQLDQSVDADQPSITENSETQESAMDENLQIYVEGDDNVAMTTEIEDHPICSNTEDENITKVIDTNPQLLPDIGHTPLRTDLTSSQEDFDDQIIKTFIDSITKSKIVPERNRELKQPIKRYKVDVSYDHADYLKVNSEDGNKTKKLKTYGGARKKVSSQKLARNINNTSIV